MFVDEYDCTVRGGKGGDGCVSFRREKFVPRGGPDGGDGGRGGDVVLVASTGENTLFHLVGKPLYEARKGQPGTPSNCTGASAAPLELRVPIGTLVIDAERGNTLRDLGEDGERFVVARGGHGGRGNQRFATSTNRAPREHEEGTPGEERRIRLSLKLIADVGLVGLPNAGKSTLLATLSRARPKVADYPFTTLEPSLGIVPISLDAALVVADIPGLIEGAHEGKGLGDKFLKHVERTRALLHLVDCSSTALETPEDAYRVIRAELAGYSEELASRPALVVATKVEDDESARRADDFEAAIGVPVCRISAAMRSGLDAMLARIRELAGR
ncbi:MAG: GTPase ObgE [Planctomycetes bacterium]|nr:GTPase ObgE [Planctomycetota bacterium]